MTQEQPAPRRRPRPTFRNVEVKGVRRVTPSIVRVTLTGETLDGWEPRGPAEHIRMWFPQPGYEAPVMPEWTDTGPVMPEGHERPVSRVYTPLRWDPAARELDVDIILHPEAGGPGSSWAETAAPGKQVVIAGPAGPYKLDPAAENLLLLCDHAGLPALTTVLDALQTTAMAKVYIEVADGSEEQDLTSAASIDVTWLHNPHTEPPGSLLIKAAESAVVAPDVRVWVACEAAAMREIRKHLLYTAGLAKDQIHTHGYWKAGESDHPDHDLGDEV